MKAPSILKKYISVIMEIDFFSKSENICKKNSVNQMYKQRYNYKHDIQFAPISTPRDIVSIIP